MQQQKYLDRREQSEYLARKGLRRSPKTLAKLACIGGGPKFVKFGQRALSTPEWLDEWAQSLISAPANSTSEHQAADQA